MDLEKQLKSELLMSVSYPLHAHYPNVVNDFFDMDEDGKIFEELFDRCVKPNI